MRIADKSPLRSLPPDRVREFQSAFADISQQGAGAFVALQNLVGQIEGSVSSRGGARWDSARFHGLPTVMHPLNDAARAICTAVCLGRILPPTSFADLDGYLAALEALGLAGDAAARPPGPSLQAGATIQKMIDALAPGAAPSAPAVPVPTSPGPSAEAGPRRVRVEVDKSSFLSPTGTDRPGGRVRVRVTCPGAEPSNDSIARAQYDVLAQLARDVRRVNLGGGDGMRQLARRTLASLARLRIRAQRYEGAGPGGIELLDLVEIVEVPTLQDRGTALRRFADDTRRQATAGDI